MPSSTLCVGRTDAERPGRHSHGGPWERVIPCSPACGLLWFGTWPGLERIAEPDPPSRSASLPTPGQDRACAAMEQGRLDAELVKHPARGIERVPFAVAAEVEPAVGSRKRIVRSSRVESRQLSEPRAEPAWPVAQMSKYPSVLSNQDPAILRIANSSRSTRTG